MSDQAKCVLLIENEPDFLDLLELAFRVEGFRTLTAHNCQDGMRKADGGGIDVVVTDIRMDDGDGYGVLKHAKRHNPHHPLVVLVSAFTDLSHEKCFALGAEAVFAKPFLLAALVERVRWLLAPPGERWAAPPPDPPVVTLDAHIPCGTGENGAGRAPAIGRGGIAVRVPGTPPAKGTRVAFLATLDRAGMPALQGSGMVWWTRTRPDDAAALCGVEFEHVHETCREPLVNWVIEQGPRHYIPPARIIA